MLFATMIGLAAVVQAGDGRTGSLQGMVVEKGTGRPVAGVSVRFSQEPNSPSATTDARGRFDGLPRIPGGAADGEQGPQAWVRAEDDRAQPWEMVEPEGMVTYQPGYLYGQAVEAVYERATTRWKGNGEGALLVVECPPVGEVEVIVRDPDGRPDVDRPAWLLPAPDFPRPNTGIIRFSVRTDREGAIRFRAFAGVHRFGVQVPGLGFGSTGLFEVASGRVARPPIPPLARFARVEGRVAPGLFAPGIKVALVSDPFQQSVGAAVPCDDQGRFVIADVIPGVYGLEARKDRQQLRSAFREVRPEPGRVLRDVVLEPAPPPTPEQQKESERTLRTLNGERNRTITWVEGTIRDERGQPIPGASVYLRSESHGGIRMYEAIQKTTADEAGRYRFQGGLLPMMGTLAIVSAAKGRPPSVAFAPGPDASIDEKDRKPAQLDLTLGTAGASASITVVRDGRKLPGASVRLAAVGGVSLSYPGYVGSARGPERQELEALVSPTARTGPDGVARFENLLPGPFEVNVMAEGGWAATALGIAAPPGGKVEAAVEVHRRPGPVRFRVVGLDGVPVANRTGSLSFGRIQATSATSIELDGEGVGTRDFDGPGLWAIEIRFRDTDLRSFPLHQEPYYLAGAMVPVSPGLVLEDPVVLRAVRHEPGSIQARLLDAGGKPARGTLMIVESFEGPVHWAGSVDAEGVVRFGGLPAGKYHLRGFVDGQPPAPRLRLGSTRFEDEALRGQATVLDREVALASGEAAKFDLRLEPVGYVRAIVRPPAGRSASDYSAYLKTDPPAENGWSYQADPKCGSYLFGPVRAGQASLLVLEKVQSGTYPRRGERAVVVEPGKVVRVEVDAEPGPTSPASPRSRQNMSLGMGGIRVFDLGPEGLAASVFLADGATPAFGARAFFYPAGSRWPTAMGIADASGRLTWTGFWRGQSEADAKGPEPPKAPTIAAWMPGLAGVATATIEAGKPVRLILPAPAGGSGRVTIGGRGIEGRAAKVRVVAEAEDRGALAGAFSQAATADPDGRFRFPGLTPGRYRVQAVRDEIWLSRSVELAIEPGREAAPIVLDIPEPGAPIELKLVDRQGRPINGLAFRIPRSEGPIAGEWPIALRTDDHGIAIVRGLEAGPQLLLAEVNRTPRPFEVPKAAPGAGAKAVRIEIDRP